VVVSQACEICREFNGRELAVDEVFKSGPRPYGNIDGPPGHPRCRCTLQWVVAAREQMPAADS